MHQSQPMHQSKAMSRLVALVVSGAALMGLGGHPAQAATRVDVPIGQLVLPDGGARYYVPVSVGGGEPFDALLDTGSFGLKVLKTAVPASAYSPKGVRYDHPFATGTLFSGILADAKLAIGGAETDKPALIQVVDHVECVGRRPDCPASKVSFADFRMAGGGFADKGFKAILGVSMRKELRGEGSENPLVDMGDARWIIVLPQPGSTAPGHLIINPSPEDLAGFVMVQLSRQRGGDMGEEGGGGWKDGALPGCLLDEASQQRFCGKTLLDTGARGFSVDSMEAEGPSSWRAGVSARFEIGGGEQPIAMTFVSGSDPASRVRVHPPRNPQVLRISAGTLPYLSYSVLYDAKTGAMGFKPRSDMAR